MAGSSARATAERTKGDHTTIADILAGRSWTDLQTLARLESGLACGLWPSYASRTGQADAKR